MTLSQMTERAMNSLLPLGAFVFHKHRMLIYKLIFTVITFTICIILIMVVDLCGNSALHIMQLLVFV